MKKWIWGVVIVIVLVVIIGITIDKEKDTSTIKIGFITFPTGPASVPGQMSVEAAKYAEKVINSSGGINGRKFEVLIGDYAYDAKRVIPTYEALKLQGVKLFLFEGSPAAGILAPLTKKNNEFLMTGVTTLPSYSDGDPMTCRIGLTAANYGPAMTDYIFSKSDKPRVALAITANDYGKGIETETTKALLAKGGTVIGVEQYDQSSGDYRTQVTKLKGMQDKIDYLILVHTGNTIGSLLKQLKEIGFNKPIVTDAITASNAGIKDTTLLNDWVVADYEYTTAIRETDSSKVKEFKLKYKSQSGFEPTLSAATTYDSVMIIAEALKDDAKTPKDVSDYLVKTIGSYDGIIGAATFNSDCEVQRPVVYRKFIDGKLIDLK